MLITDKNEIVRLKLIHGHIYGKIIEFTEKYSVDGHFNVRTYIFALVHSAAGYWSIVLVEADGKSKQNKWGGYGGGSVGQEKYIKGKWKEIVNSKKPTWQIERYNELQQRK